MRDTVRTACSAAVALVQAAGEAAAVVVVVWEEGGRCDCGGEMGQLAAACWEE